MNDQLKKIVTSYAIISLLAIVLVVAYFVSRPTDPVADTSRGDGIGKSVVDPVTGEEFMINTGRPSVTSPFESVAVNGTVTLIDDYGVSRSLRDELNLQLRQYVANNDIKPHEHFGIRIEKDSIERQITEGTRTKPAGYALLFNVYLNDDDIIAVTLQSFGPSDEQVTLYNRDRSKVLQSSS